MSGHVGKKKAKIAASMCLDRSQFRDSERNVCVLQVRNAVPPAGDRQSPGSRWSIKHPNRLLLASFNQTITCRREPKRPLTTCTLPGGEANRLLQADLRVVQDQIKPADDASGQNHRFNWR